MAMNFSFRHVEVFWAVMTTGSATAAAQLLHTSQPTISRELARFEQVTGLRLFTRLNGKLAPTEQAAMLFDEVQRAYVGLERIAKTIDGIRHFSQGQVSIACLPAFSHALLPRACQQFRERFPGVSLKISPHESPTLEETLSTQRYHLGLTEAGDAPPGTVSDTLLTLDVVCVVPDAHPLALRPDKTITPHDLEEQDFVYLAACDPYRQEVDRVFDRLGIARRMVVETTSAGAVCELVGLGVGVAIVNPLTALSYVGHGLTIRRFALPIPYVVNLVRPRFRSDSAIVDSFVEALQARCRQIEHELRVHTG
jgi:DNA-binding transcriptional LysR family regulator